MNKIEGLISEFNEKYGMATKGQYYQLLEEIGELAEAIQIDDPGAIMEESADVMFVSGSLILLEDGELPELNHQCTDVDDEFTNITFNSGFMESVNKKETFNFHAATVFKSAYCICFLKGGDPPERLVEKAKYNLKKSGGKEGDKVVDDVEEEE